MDVDIGKLPPRGLARRLDEWSGEARSGRTQLGFDDWFAGVALPGRVADAGINLRQNKLAFVLQHGRRYVITDEHRGIRAFECRIDGQLPIVAFIDAVGNRGPWLTLQRLFTIEEIVSLRPWNSG
nr:hypothetical protein [uncultured Cupriavidus sp.]